MPKIYTSDGLGATKVLSSDYGYPKLFLYLNVSAFQTLVRLIRIVGL